MVSRQGELRCAQAEAFAADPEFRMAMQRGGVTAARRIEIDVSLVFEHETKGQRVLFGSGRAAAHLSAEITRLGSRTPLVIAGTRHQDLIARAGLADATRHCRIVEHVPIDVADQARSVADSSNADLVIAVGGGSATGLAKAVALTSGLPIVAVATTFAGSEATDVWGLTENGRKRTGIDPRVLPATVIYDADLLTGLPAGLAVASGLNAIAHCVDSMWGPRADPINAALAMEGLRALRSGLPCVVSGESDAAELALYGCYLAAVAFASAGSGLHHKICHVLGGAFDLPHAATHAIVLPHVLAFNAPYARAAADRIATALGDIDACDGLDRLRTSLHAPDALRELGFQDDDIPAAAMLILAEAPPTNPRPVDVAALTGLLYAAWSGSDPQRTRTDRTGWPAQ
jgi:maleylacetate reductase